VPAEPEAEHKFALLGSQLAAAVVEAVPSWIARSVMMRFDEWTAASGTGGPSRETVSKLAESAGGRAAAEVEGQLRDLLSSDVDQQWTTPLALVRPLVSYAGEVLAGAGVPGIERDEFQTLRFAGDDYGLTPASLAVLGDRVGELAIAWGASKAIAHRLRHRS
jgi:hypothetical protein